MATSSGTAEEVLGTDFIYWRPFGGSEPTVGLLSTGSMNGGSRLSDVAPMLIQVGISAALAGDMPPVAPCDLTTPCQVLFW